MTISVTNPAASPSRTPLHVTWTRTLPLLERFARPANSVAIANPARVLLTRPVRVPQDWFPQQNSWLYTVVTVGTPDKRETFAIPTLDVPLVHAALELAAMEHDIA